PPSRSATAWDQAALTNLTAPPSRSCWCRASSGADLHTAQVWFIFFWAERKPHIQFSVPPSYRFLILFNQWRADIPVCQAGRTRMSILRFTIVKHGGEKQNGRNYYPGDGHCQCRHFGHVAACGTRLILSSHALHLALALRVGCGPSRPPTDARDAIARRISAVGQVWLRGSEQPDL